MIVIDDSDPNEEHVASPKAAPRAGTYTDRVDTDWADPNCEAEYPIKNILLGQTTECTARLGISGPSMYIPVLSPRMFYVDRAIEVKMAFPSRLIF